MTAAFLDWFGDNRNGRYILEGFLVNLEIAVIAMVLAFALGLVLALLRLTRSRPVSVVAGAWVDVFRNLPLILLILFMALLLPPTWRDAWTDNVPGWAPEAFQSGLVLGAFLALILYNSAVLAEIMRSGILSLPRGQGEAAAALGLSYAQSLRHVILPQGTLNKDTTLVSIIAIQEVVRRGRTVIANAGNPFTGSEVEAPFLEVFLFIGVLFVIVNYLLSRLARRLEIRETKAGGGATAKTRVSGLEDQVA